MNKEKRLPEKITFKNTLKKVTKPLTKLLRKEEKYGGDILHFRTNKSYSSETRTILSVGSVVFTGGLFIDKDTETFCKNVFNHFN